MKKIFLFLAFLMLVPFVNSATINTTVCPTFASGNTYVFQDGYAGGVCTITADNVILTSDSDDLGDINLFWAISGRNNVTITGFTAENFGLQVDGPNTFINISHNHIYDFEGRQITGSGNIGGLVVFNAGTGTPSVSNLTIADNYIMNQNNAGSKDSNVFGIYASTGGTTFQLDDLVMERNDFINLQSLFYAEAGLGRTATYNINSFDSEENIYDIEELNENQGAGTENFNYPTSASCDGFDTSDMLTYITYNEDANVDFRDDVLTTLSSGSCTYLNTNMLTQKPLNNIDNTIALAFTRAETSYYSNNNRYYIVKDLALDSSHLINLQSNQEVDIYLIAPNEIEFSDTNQMRMGFRNSLTGQSQSGAQPQLTTTGTINVSHSISLPTATNWALITFTNDFIIDNVEFTDTNIGNKGYIRAFSTSTGDFLTIRNTVFDTNGINFDTGTPLIYAGSFINIENTTFDIRGSHDRIVTGGGVGGNSFIDNTFIGAGQVFQDMGAGLTAFTIESIANHNKFMDGGSFESYPFDPVSLGLNPGSGITASNFKLNGSYVYQSICDSYEFNVGNWYDDISDNATLCVDGNGDDICDTPYLRSNTGSNIIDSRVLEIFPYDFAGNTGSLIPTDLCGSLFYNFVNPINNSDYSDGTDFVTDWEFISTAYPLMQCFQNLNGQSTLITDVGSGDNIQLEYDLLTGIYDLEITCQDKEVAPEIVRSSGIITFTINNGTDYVVPDAPVVVSGGNGGNGTGGNGGSGSNGEGTDFSETQFINFANPDATGEDTILFVQNIINFFLNWFVPFAVLFMILLVILAFFILVA